MTGDFDFRALAKATPGYVGADLSALTGAAGVIAVKRIFRQLARMDSDPPESRLSSSTIPPGTLSGVGEGVEMMLDSPPNSELSAVDPPEAPSLPGILRTSTISNFLQLHPNPLTEEELAPLTISYEDFISALSQIQPSSKREGFATIPDVTWADIGALHSTREELHMAIVQPIRRPEVFKAVGITAPCGVLLWGPPGCGKTLLAKAVANESRANFISVKGPELLNKVRLGTELTSYMVCLYDLFSMWERASVLCGKYFRGQPLRRLAWYSSTSWMPLFLDAMTAWYCTFIAIVRLRAFSQD